jgi:hypothetical protein
MILPRFPKRVIDSNRDPGYKDCCLLDLIQTPMARFHVVRRRRPKLEGRVRVSARPPTLCASLQADGRFRKWPSRSRIDSFQLILWYWVTKWGICEYFSPRPRGLVSEKAANVGAGRQYIDARVSYIRHGMPCPLGRGTHIARLLRDYVAKLTPLTACAGGSNHLLRRLPRPLFQSYGT